MTGEARSTGATIDGLPSFRLDGKVALITGSGRGIGYALARGLALSGAHVVLNGLDEDRLRTSRERLQAELTGRHLDGVVHSRAFDVTDHDAVHAAVEDIETGIGPIDVLINNAGIQIRGALTEMAVDDWKRVVDVNLTSGFVVGRTVARHMLDRHRGKIINICSVQNNLVRATTAPYAAAKGGLGNLTKVMCAEWARDGLQINGLAPGYLDTDLNTALVADPAFSAWIIGRTPAARWGDVDDLVGPAVWLSSDASNFVNGQVIFVDGGLTAVI